MPELFTRKELQDELRDAVKQAGSAKKFLRKHKLYGYDHALHMIENGTAATRPDVMMALGFRAVERFELIKK